MSFSVGISAVALIVGLVSWWSVRQLITLLSGRGMVDTPNNRSLHDGVVPRGGGLVIALSLIISLLAVAIWSERWLFFGGLAVLMLAWTTLSWYDDKLDLSPRFRFAMQFMIAVLTVLMFGWVNSLAGFQLGWLGVILSVIGVLWMANLYNFMDGMDGLAASQSIIASITLGFWFYMSANTALAAVCAVVAASSYGFLYWNWRPAKIFMGDVGSITLGGFFATMIIIAVNRHDFPVISLLLIFAVFILDATITLLRRLMRKEKIWLAHRNHYYQRLANIGVSHTKIVCVAIVMMLLCSLIATLSVLYRDIMIFAVIGVIGLNLGALFLVKYLESQASLESQARDK